MYNPIILERDTPFLSWTDDDNSPWCTASSAAAAANIVMRSSGVLNEDSGSMVCRGTTTMIANEIRSNGIHLRGPYDELALDEHVVYQYDVCALSTDVNLIPLLFCAISPASITSSAGGDTVSEVHAISYAQNITTIGNTLNAQGTFAVPKTDHIAVNRHIAFGVGMMAGPAAAAGTNTMYARLCVRRLVNLEPSILDTRKL